MSFPKLFGPTLPRSPTLVPTIPRLTHMTSNPSELDTPSLKLFCELQTRVIRDEGSASATEHNKMLATTRK